MLRINADTTIDNGNFNRRPLVGVNHRAPANLNSSSIGRILNGIADEIVQNLLDMMRGHFAD